jgi:hypothetical protein
VTTGRRRRRRDRHGDVPHSGCEWQAAELPKGGTRSRRFLKSAALRFSPHVGMHSGAVGGPPSRDGARNSLAGFKLRQRPLRLVVRYPPQARAPGSISCLRTGPPTGRKPPGPWELSARPGTFHWHPSPIPVLSGMRLSWFQVKLLLGKRPGGLSQFGHCQWQSACHCLPIP